MKCLIYCTKSKWRMFFDKIKNIFSLSNKKSEYDLNGKIVAEFDGEVEDLFIRYSAFAFFMHTKTMTKEQLFKDSCLSQDDFEEYMPNYAIHINNLKIFEKSKELKEYFIPKPDQGFLCLKKAPQNMMKVYDKDDTEYVLISIRPEWACKILNGEKTIEVRKKVLNCMKEE